MPGEVGSVGGREVGKVPETARGEPADNIKYLDYPKEHKSYIVSIPHMMIEVYSHTHFI